MNDVEKYWEVRCVFHREFEGPKGGLKIKKVSERYLVDSQSATEAEAKVTKFLKDCKDEWEIKSARASSIIEVI